MSGARPRLLVLDSGLGGLTVLAEIRAARPDAEVAYVADDLYFPYGGLGDATLVDRMTTLVAGEIADAAFDCVVIACNTASTLVLGPLRARFDVPFVGTVPAVKPAAKASLSKRFSVLATPGTVARDYTRELIATYAADCRVTLVGAPRLAAHAEAVFAGEDVSDEALREEIAPCFVEDEGGRTDAVVLACTHYPLLTPRLERVALWPVAWLDPAPAIARRVVSLVGEPPPGARPGIGTVRFTTGRRPREAVVTALAARGLRLA